MAGPLGNRGTRKRPTVLPPASDGLAGHLRQRILSGELAPRAPLNQNDLANEYGLNRSQVRDALRTLAHERLVVMRAYATAIVAPLSLYEFQELHELRMALEPMLARIALPSILRPHVLQMRELLRVMSETEDGATWLDANDEFHELLYRQAARPWILEIVERARRLSTRYTRILIFELGSRDPDAEHAEILDVIEAQDFAGLERLLTAHMRKGHDLVFGHLIQHPEMLDALQDVRPVAAL
jgi:DNA-binding GntR family transcriptional regulator